MAPELGLNETQVYREFAPPAHLRGSIACLWVRRGDGGTVRVIPDACSDIIWRPGQGAVVAGPDTRPSLVQTVAGEAIFGARLLPGAGGSALGLPLDELRELRVPLSDLGLDPREWLGGGLDPRDAPRLLAATAARLAADGPPDRAVQAAAVRLLNPRQRVSRLARELGFSERQLHRRFRASVGYGPKTLQCVLRLRLFLAGPRSDLVDAALDAGYCDQAHLARECGRLTGLTPTRLLEHWRRSG